LAAAWPGGLLAQACAAGRDVIAVRCTTPLTLTHSRPMATTHASPLICSRVCIGLRHIPNGWQRKRLRTAALQDASVVVSAPRLRRIWSVTALFHFFRMRSLPTDTLSQSQA
jgi:hypothetical protein